MSYFVFWKLGVESCKPTSVTLQFANSSLKKLKGFIEGILVKVGKFIYPVDYIVLDMEADLEVPLILGRPFLAIGIVIDVQKGKLVMRVENEEIKFNVFKALKYPIKDSECMIISTV